MNYIGTIISPILDHGFVRLVEYMGSDLSIVRNARVSYDAEWRTGEDAGKDEKLIHYLLRNRHSSPFECVTFTFDIKCPFFVARQWHRHRTWAYNEVSARYSVLPREAYVPSAYLIGTQGTGNKQVREIKPGLSFEELDQAEKHKKCIEDTTRQVQQIYEILLNNGCPREVARMVLPMNTYTHFFGTVNLHNLFHFLRLRLHPHAQWEIQQYAKALLELITPVVPVAVEAFKKTLEEKNESK